MSLHKVTPRVGSGDSPDVLPLNKGAWGVLTYFGTPTLYNYNFGTISEDRILLITLSVIGHTGVDKKFYCNSRKYITKTVDKKGGDLVRKRLKNSELPLTDTIHFYQKRE